MRRLATVVMIGLGALLLCGCDDRAEDKEALRALFANVDTCYNSSDGVGVLALYTQSTFEYYDRLLPIILDGSREAVKELPPGYQYEVVLARLKSTRAQLAGLSGRQYMSMATRSGWYVIPPEYRTNDTLGDFQFLGQDEAWASIYTEGEKTGLSLCFRREDGVWKVDASAVDLYAQDTPKHAVQGFVRALERKRYDVVLRYVPESHREGLDAAKLKAAWEGDEKNSVEQLVAALKQALPTAAIEEAGERATMTHGAGTLQLVREHGLWKIENFD